MYSAFGKYSDPLTFHILLLYSLILKWIFKKEKIILSCLYSIPQKDKAKTGLDILANVLKIKNRNSLFT